jgi:hypothetical protein
LLGALMLIEPAALYYCVYILSDSFFASFTLLYLATLFFYISERKNKYLFLHILLLLCCIEIRLAGLIYLFFSSLVFLFFLKNIKRSILNILLLLLCWSALHRVHVKWAERKYGSPVFSSFSGWNSSNDALYIARHIKCDTSKIKDPQTKWIVTYFSNYLDTCSIDPHPIGSDYLWVDKSPLTVLAKKYADSFKTEGYYVTWARLAPLFDKYGKYVQTHFPLQYIRWYMIPNLKSLVNPYDHELADYYLLYPIPKEYFPIEFQIDQRCRLELYKKYVIGPHRVYYHIRMILLIVSFLIIRIVPKIFDSITRKFLFALFFFVFIYYFLILFSSWFVFRFLIPVFPVMNVIMFITALSIVKYFSEKKSDKNKAQ